MRQRSAPLLVIQVEGLRVTLTYSDLHAYFTLLGQRPPHWQLDAIRRLDRVVMAAAYQRKG